MDITYIPMRRGFVYLAAVVDVSSRRVLAHRVSITMEAAFCVEALEEALAILRLSVIAARMRGIQLFEQPGPPAVRV